MKKKPYFYNQKNSNKSYEIKEKRDNQSQPVFRTTDTILLQRVFFCPMYRALSKGISLPPHHNPVNHDIQKYTENTKAIVLSFHWHQK